MGHVVVIVTYSCCVFVVGWKQKKTAISSLLSWQPEKNEGSVW